MTGKLLTDAELAEFRDFVKDRPAISRYPAEAVVDLFDHIDALQAQIENLNNQINSEMLSTAAEVLANCDGCSAPMLAGELAHSGEDCTLCEECAPTYGEMRQQIIAHPDTYGDCNPEKQLADIHAYVDGGGSLTDKMVHPL